MWLGRARPLPPQQVKDPSSQFHMFTVFNELTEMKEAWGERERVSVCVSELSRYSRTIKTCVPVNVLSFTCSSNMHISLIIECIKWYMRG